MGALHPTRHRRRGNSEAFGQSCLGQAVLTEQLSDSRRPFGLEFEMSVHSIRRCFFFHKCKYTCEINSLCFHLETIMHVFDRF